MKSFPSKERRVGSTAMAELRYRRLLKVGGADRCCMAPRGWRGHQEVHMATPDIESANIQPARTEKQRPLRPLPENASTTEKRGKGNKKPAFPQRAGVKRGLPSFCCSWGGANHRAERRRGGVRLSLHASQNSSLSSAGVPQST